MSLDNNVTTAEAGLIAMLEPLWKAPASELGDIANNPRFKALEAYCASRYDAAKPEWAIRHALSALGLPGHLQHRHRRLAIDLPSAAAALDAAFRQRTARRRHICPLDRAGELPRMRFGPVQIGRCTGDELAQLFDAPRLIRTFQNAQLDLASFRQFHWLIVDEDIPLDPRPDARARPFWYANMGEDFGRVEPHIGSVPQAVENVLFFMLLAPWEVWSSHREVDWRCFQLPWVYTIDDDIFAQPTMPPSPSSLSWEPHIYDSPSGETEEVEYPEAIPLEHVEQTEIEQLHSDAALQRLESALATPMFETPIVHFLVRGFLTFGVDEVLAHLTTIEAALGHHDDYRKKGHPKLSATAKLSAKIRGLLDDVPAGDQYADLFDWRSRYLHGRGGLEPLSSVRRLQARSLARRVAAALVKRAAASTGSRREFLHALLQKGLSLHGAAGATAT